MDQAKQTINSTVQRRQFVFRKTAAETNGELLEIEAHYPPQDAYPPDHYHPDQDEYFELLKGRLRVRLNGREYIFNAGQTIHIPRGTVHSMRNSGETEASMIWQIRPAMQTQAFHETLAGLAADGKTNRQGVPNLLQMAVLLQTYRAEFVLSRPVLPIQKMLFGGLALIGRLFGYRGRYEKYSGPEPQGQNWRTAQASIWIEQRPEEVFRYIANYNNDPQWRQGLARMTQSPADVTEVGTVTHEEKDLLGRRFVTTAKVTAFEPDKRLDWASVEAAIPVKGWRMVEPEGSGTRFTQVIMGDLQGIYRWLAPIMVSTLKKEMAQDLAKLKEILEEGI